MNNQDVKFLKGTAQQYDSITHNPYYFYFLTDTEKVYLGDVQLSNTSGSGNVVSHTVEQWSANDHALERQKSSQDTFYIYTNRQVNNTLEPGLKIGDGSSYIIDLPFLDSIYISHIQNTDMHVTTTEKSFWNDKMNSQAIYNSNTETLTFTKGFNI